MDTCQFTWNVEASPVRTVSSAEQMLDLHRQSPKAEKLHEWTKDGTMSVENTK